MEASASTRPPTIECQAGLWAGHILTLSFNFNHTVMTGTSARAQYEHTGGDILGVFWNSLAEVVKVC